MTGEQAIRHEALFCGFNLEDHVPANYLLRSIDRFGERSRWSDERRKAGIPSSATFIRRLNRSTKISTMKQQGCEAVVLGCTEIPLIMNDGNAPLPTLDSTRLLARAALRRATAS